MIIHPYSDVNLVAPTQENFPALASFFKFDETSGTTITDAIAGVVHTDAVNIEYDSTAGGVSCNIAAGTAPTSGTVPLPGTADILIVTAVMASSTRSQTVVSAGFGSSSAVIGRALVASNTTGASTCSFCNGVDASVSTTALSALTQDVWTVHSLAVTRGAVLQSRRVTSGSAVATQTSASTAPAGDITDPNYQRLRFAGVFRGYAAFYFTGGLPADWEAAAYWMGAQWIAGNKIIYPGWKDLS